MVKPRKQSNGIRYVNRAMRCRAAGSVRTYSRGPVTEIDDVDVDDLGYDDESVVSNDNDSSWDDDATLMALLDE